MKKFEIYELSNESKSISPDEDSSLSLKDTELEDQIQNNIQETTLLLVFVRMSSKRKMNLLTKVFQHVRNIRVLADTLNTFFAVNTKLISYSKISTDSNTLYEQFVQDDDRMMNADVLEEWELNIIKWFKTLQNTEQLNIITSLLRISGGSIIKKMYVRLMKIFNERNSEEKQNFREYKSSSSMLFSNNCDEKPITFSDFQPKYTNQNEENDYNPDCPTSKKVVEARKQWQASMGKIRKEIEIELQKLNEPITQRMKEKQPIKEFDSVKMKGSKISKNVEMIKKVTINKAQETDIDWVQFLPIWNVKKIFSYLDEKTLHNLKNVNNYWAAISKQVLAEIKAREYIDATIKQSVELLDNLIKIPLPQSTTEIRVDKIVTEPSGFKKRMEKQRRTATSLRRKEEDTDNLQNKCVLSECFKEFDAQDTPLFTQLQPFPIDRVTGIPTHTGQEASSSLSEVISMRVPSKRTSEQKSSSSSKEDMKSSGSGMSLIPSIMVSMENMETW